MPEEAEIEEMRKAARFYGRLYRKEKDEVLKKQYGRAMRYWRKKLKEAEAGG